MDTMTNLDIQHLDSLRRTYQARSEDLAQAWLEWWNAKETAEAEAAKTAAGAQWLTAVHAAWPEILAGLES
jgi:hypothetical protein